jgi:hypothetical protein
MAWRDVVAPGAGTTRPFGRTQAEETPRRMRPPASAAEEEDEEEEDEEEERWRGWGGWSPPSPVPREMATRSPSKQPPRGAS